MNVRTERWALVASILVLVVIGVLAAAWLYLTSPVPVETLPVLSATTTTSGATSSPQTAAGPLTVPAPQTATTTPVIKVLKSVAGLNYSLAINSLYADTQYIATLENTRLVPILQTIQTKAAQKDYVGILTLLGTARGYAQQGSAMVPRLQADIAALRAAQSSVTDAAVATATTRLIASAQSYHAALVTYFATLTPVISGGFPSTQQVAAFTAADTNAADAAATVATDLKAVSDLLIARIQNS